jgi:hypothetical protein
MKFLLFFTPQFTQYMRHTLLIIGFIIAFSSCALSVVAQSSVKVNKSSAGVTNKQGNGAAVSKEGTKVSGNNGGSAVTNKDGAAITSAKGGKASAEKGKVQAKSASGKGVEANKKGLDVKGKNGGMQIEKGKFEIKSKKLNVKIGDK